VLRLASLSARLILAVLATATIAFAGFVALAVWRLDLGLERQAEELTRLSETRIIQKLDGEARLARARVEMMFNTMGRLVESLAQRADIAGAVSSNNIVAMSETLGRSVSALDIDGVIVIDPKLRVLGAHSGDVDLLAANAALNLLPIAGDILPLLQNNDRKAPRNLRRVVTFDERTAPAFGSRQRAAMVFVTVDPLFDDFGDVSAALVTHRVLRPLEATLAEFSRLEGAGLAVQYQGRTISIAGTDNANTTIEAVAGTDLLRTGDGRFWSRCVPMFDDYRICALAPVGELHALRDEMVRVGQREGKSLTSWLLLAAAASLALFALIMLIASRRITRPLEIITEAVRAVSRGDWKAHVDGLERQDEIGGIARAVVMLQHSLEERDRLRADVADANVVRQRREELESAINRFDRVMRSVLLTVGDCAESMDETARELARVSAVAEGEAAEATFVSESTLQGVATVQQATERLNASLAETVEHLRSAALAADANVTEAAGSSLRRLAGLTEGVAEISGSFEDAARRINVVALNATMQASRAGTQGAGFAPMVADLNALAARMDSVVLDIGSYAVGIRDSADETSNAIYGVSQTFGTLLEEARAIASAVERQDRATRDIAEGITAAAGGSVNVAASLRRLKATIEEARSNAQKVVDQATDMADEARRLDVTVKSFLREVTTKEALEGVIPAGGTTGEPASREVRV
jgi:methyl-accepting chemotaxis protein